MNTYFEVEAYLEGERFVFFGSFDRTDCVGELDAERDGWKEEGYKKIKIVSHQTADEPDPEVYSNLVTKHELWMQQAPSFNFELGEDELLEAALSRGYVTKSGTDTYLINEDY